MSRVNKLKELFRLVCVAFFAITLVSTLTACSESIDELLDTDVLPEVEFPDPIPPSTPPAEPDIELETLHEVFFGAYGCQRSPALSIVNYNPSLPLENSECFGQSVIGGGNPTQLFDMSDGLYLELDTDVDPLFENEYIVYANDGALFLLDKESNNSRRLTSFSGEICRLLSRKTYLSEFDSSLNQETWREHDDSLVYVEVIYEEFGHNVCDDESLPRNYIQLSLNYDEYADDAELCATEEGGKNKGADCKTKLGPIVSSAHALSHLIRGYVDDLDTADVNDKKQVFGYLGWTKESPAKLVFFDHNGDELWRQARQLERFDSVEGFGGAYQHGFAVQALADNHYALQLGRDIFLFEGSELFGLNNNTASALLSDRVYLMDEQGTQLSRMRAVHDDDDFLLFDNAKFFSTDYKSAYVAPTLSRDYVIQKNVASYMSAYVNDFEFSQFEMSDCSKVADKVGCKLANDVREHTWKVTSSCDALLGCMQPIDLTDYCVTDAEKTGTTPADELCTASRYQDLNELNTVVNDLSFASYLPYYADYMRGLDFQVYQDQLLMTVRLSEGDALVLWDYKKPLATSREQLLFGQRLMQSMSRPVIQDGGIYVTSAVAGARGGAPNADIYLCFKKGKEVECQLSVESDGRDDVCTGKDERLGACRQGRYTFESRALFCSDAQIVADPLIDPDSACGDFNQVNSLARQIEDASHDAQWLPTISVDSINGIQRTMRLVMSVDQQSSSDFPNASYVRDEGVLVNPELYQIVDPQTLGPSEGGMAGSVESIPSSLVVRNGVGRYEVNAEEFLGGGLDRQVNSYYIDENINANALVTGARQAQ